MSWPGSREGEVINMPPIRTSRKPGQDKLPEDGKADKGLGYLEGKVNERVQPVVQALNEMKPVFIENTKAIKELTKTLRAR
jgi:hypothetical protein